MMEKWGFEMEAEALAICPWEGLAVTEHKPVLQEPRSHTVTLLGL